MQTTVTAPALLLEVLKKLAPDSSINTLRSWIDKGRVTVAGKVVAKSNHPVLPGEEVVIGHRVHFARGGIKILFEDKTLVVLEKPPGLLSVATDFKDEHTVHTILKRRDHIDRVYPVHRLDRDTSGVMLFAYTEAARDHLKEQFEKRLVEKMYIAVIEGKLNPQEGKWESFLAEDARFFVASTSSEQTGKLAITLYKVVAQNRRYSRLHLKLQTGRKNQLRVHCREAGVPIVGDKKYGSDSNPIKRLCLHAQSITFVHPVLGKKMTFEAALPQEFDQLV